MWSSIRVCLPARQQLLAWLRNRATAVCSLDTVVIPPNKIRDPYRHELQHLPSIGNQLQAVFSAVDATCHVTSLDLHLQDSMNPMEALKLMECIQQFTKLSSFCLTDEQVSACSLLWWPELTRLTGLTQLAFHQGPVQCHDQFCTGTTTLGILDVNSFCEVFQHFPLRCLSLTKLYFLTNLASFWTDCIPHNLQQLHLIAISWVDFAPHHNHSGNHNGNRQKVPEVVTIMTELR